MTATTQGYLFDLDGTIYTGNQLIPGAAETIARLEKSGIPFRFVTNTTSKPRSVIVKKLESLGINVPAGHIFTAPAIAAGYLQSENISDCYVLVQPSLLVDLPAVQHTDEKPQAVLVGDMGDDFTYNKINRAFRFLMEGSRFISLANNRFFKKSDGLYIDVGAFVAALEFATQSKAECIGKPSLTFFKTAADDMGIDLKDLTMIGDDLESDVLGAQAHGLTGILVRTGKFKSSTLDQAKTQPNRIIDSVADLLTDSV
jgi:HAD superfamily hydrolase (TIGR01458 family)